jgi:hypothetical protein
VARPQSSSPYTGVADVLECRRCRSRLPSVLDHDDLSSRLSISLRIFRVFGTIEFGRLCIYIGPAARQVDYHQAYQAIQSILCCAYITTIIVISSKPTFTCLVKAGQINNIRYKWFERCFEPQTQLDNKNKWRLLIVDSHASYATTKAIKFCLAYKIILL